MNRPQPIPISKLIDALLDTSTPFHPRYLSRLSDLDPEDTARLAEVWPRVTVQRRQALLEDLEEAHIDDDLLNYEAVARIALEDPEPFVRSLAINILREYELVDLLPTFTELSQQDPDTGVRASAASALATYIYMGEVDELAPGKLQRVEEVLLRLLSSSDSPLVHRKALESLGYSSRKEVHRLIEEAYTSNDRDWVVSALLAMGRSANPRWKAHVLKMLDHSQPDVRAEAASAAGELEIHDAVPVLLDLLDDTDLDVRMAAIWALSQVGGAGVREALENQLETTEFDEEASQISSALDNLEFTEEMRDISLLEIDEDGDDDEYLEDEFDDIEDDLISKDGKD